MKSSDPSCRNAEIRWGLASSALHPSSSTPTDRAEAYPPRAARLNDGGCLGGDVPPRVPSGALFASVQNGHRTTCRLERGAMSPNTTTTAARARLGTPCRRGGDALVDGAGGLAKLHARRPAVAQTERRGGAAARPRGRRDGRRHGRGCRPRCRTGRAGWRWTCGCGRCWCTRARGVLRASRGGVSELQPDSLGAAELFGASRAVVG